MTYSQTTRSVLSWCGVLMLLAGCSEERVLLSEDRPIYTLGQCSLNERATTSKHGVNSGYRIHLILSCGEEINKYNRAELELFQTRYSDFFTIKTDKNDNVLIEYCQYRSFTTFDEFRNNINSAKELFSQMLTFNMIPINNKTPCIRHE